MDFTHLDALNLRLSHERARLLAATKDTEKLFRAAWVQQIEKEIANERRFLGLGSLGEIMMSDDELLNELMA